MSAVYLRYLEEQPARYGPGSVVRLAVALETSTGQLLGQGTQVPPGRAPAGERPTLEALSRDESERLIASGGVGRVALVEDRGPVAFPVNFAVVDGDIVFRTAEGSAEAVGDGNSLGFEVDQLDEAMREGWSVLVTGRVRRVRDPEELARVRALGVSPWAGGDRSAYLRLTPEEVTGRRIRQVK